MDEQQARETEPSTPATPEAPGDGLARADEAAAGTMSPPDSSSDGRDDVRRKFQEALARKQSRGPNPHGQAAGGRGIGHEAGAHTQRQFRRKSG